MKSAATPLVLALSGLSLLACGAKQSGDTPGECGSQAACASGGWSSQATGGSTPILDDGSAGSASTGASGGSGGFDGFGGSDGTGSTSSDGGSPGNVGLAALDEDPSAAECPFAFDAGAGGAGGAPSGDAFGSTPFRVTTLRIDEGHAYVGGDDESIWRLPLAGGAPELIGAIPGRNGDSLWAKAAPELAVDSTHVYYLTNIWIDDNPSVFRRNKAGGGQQSAPNLFDIDVHNPLGFVLTPEHVIEFQNGVVIAIDKADLDASKILGPIPTNNVRRPVFDGKSVIWLDGEAKHPSPSLQAFDVHTGAVRTIFGRKTHFDDEGWNLYGADCENVYFETCESIGHFCTAQRVPTAGGSIEAYAAIDRVDAIEQTAIADGTLYFARENGVYRVTSPSAAAELVWEGEGAGDISALSVGQGALYVAWSQADSSDFFALPL